MTIKPLSDHILVKPKQAEEVTASGIVLPDTVDKEKKAEGEVIAIGPGKLLKDGNRGAMEVSVGDVILYKKWGGDDVEIEGVEHKIISADDVLAVVQK